MHCLWSEREGWSKVKARDYCSKMYFLVSFCYDKIVYNVGFHRLTKWALYDLLKHSTRSLFFRSSSHVQEFNQITYLLIIINYAAIDCSWFRVKTLLIILWTTWYSTPKTNITSKHHGIRLYFIKGVGVASAVVAKSIEKL